MKFYRVGITEERERFVTVEARSEEEALEKAIRETRPEKITEPYPPEIVGISIKRVDGDG